MPTLVGGPRHQVSGWPQNVMIAGIRSLLSGKTRYYLEQLRLGTA